MKKLKVFDNFFVIPLLLVIIMEGFFVSCNSSLFFPFSFLWVFFSLIFLILFFILLLGITGNSSFSYIILFVVFFVLCVINQLKILYTGEPIFFSDFKFLNSSSNFLNFVHGSLISNLFSIIVQLFLFFIVLFILSILSFKVKICLNSLKQRIICLVCSVFLIFILFFPFSWCKSFYKSFFFANENKFDFSHSTTYVSLYGSYGIIGGMYYQLIDSRFEEPDNYNPLKLNKILDDVEICSNKSVGTPNIIVILSESFFDVDLLKENISFDKKITSNFQYLKNKGYLVNVISPSYGGLTANVTYELLSGGNMSYFDSGYVPFMQYYNNKNSFNSPSIVRDLSNNGYYSQIILGEDSYNSSNVFNMLGFNSYKKLTLNEDNVKGDYVSDDYIADLIIDHLKEGRNKDFYMVETMQSHMEYLVSKYSNYDISIKDSELSLIDSDVLLSYAQGIYDADKMLRKVYDAIMEVDEDTIVVFFGDHLPYLKNVNGENVVEKLDYFNTNDEKLNLYRRYNTQALILSNYDLNLDIDSYLGFDLLLTTLINQMDIDVSPYYKWLYGTADVLSGYNRYVAVDKIGEVSYLNDLGDNMLEEYNLRNQMMYKMFIEDIVN